MLSGDYIYPYLTSLLLMYEIFAHFPISSMISSPGRNYVFPKIQIESFVSVFSVCHPMPEFNMIFFSKCQLWRFIQRVYIFKAFHICWFFLVMIQKNMYWLTSQRTLVNHRTTKHMTAWYSVSDVNCGLYLKKIQGRYWYWKIF